MSLLNTELEDLARAIRQPSAASAGHWAAAALLVRRSDIVISCNVMAQPGVEHACSISLTPDGIERFERHFPAELGAARAMAELPGGALVLAGDVPRGDLAFRATLVVLDEHGYATAASALGPPGATGFLAAAVDAAGAIWAGGMSSPSALAALADPHAKVQWLAALRGCDEISGLCASHGAIVFVGTRGRTTTAFGAPVWAELEAEGAVVNVSALAVARAEPAAVTAGPDGATVACGHGEPTVGGRARLWVARRDPGGAIAWWRWHGSGQAPWRARAIACDAQGLWVLGDVAAGAARSVRVVRLAQGGEVRWERVLTKDERAHEVGNAIGVMADGGAVVAVTTTVGPGRTNARISRLTEDGEVAWDKTYGRAQS